MNVINPKLTLPRGLATKLILSAAVVLLVGWVATGVYRLPEGAAAVVVQSGKATTVMTPGWHFANPSGISGSVQIVRMNEPYIVEYGFRTQKSAANGSAAQYQEVPDEAENLTLDGGYIHAEVVVQLLPTDPYKWVYRSADRTNLVRYIVASTMLKAWGQASFADGLQGPLQQQITADLKKEIDAFLKEQDIGARVQSVNLQNVQGPKEVREAQNKVATAKADADAAILRAQQAQAAAVADAQAKATNMKADADRYYAETVGQAKGTAAQYTQWLAEYKQNPALAGSKLYYESLNKLIARKGIQIYLMREDGNTVKYMPMP
ncbi:MAG: SPFH domain-containing protein [Mycobacterium leprae]